MSREETVRGRRAVLEALRAGRRKVRRILILDTAKGSVLEGIREAAARRGVAVASVPARELDALSGEGPHRGVAALVEKSVETGLDDIIAAVGAGATASGRAGFVLALDELKDPQNVGAIVRTAEGAGAHGVLMTSNRSAPVGEGVARASAGAVEHLPVVRVVNLRDALERLKRAGLWIVGADAEAEKDYTAADFRRPTVLVLGEEGKGLRSLTRRTCDELVRIPLQGRVASLNVSAAAAVLCFEVVRQRRGAA